MKLIRLPMAICLWACLQSHAAFACRYTVRDIGFVDLGAKPYYLYGYVTPDTPADISSSFTQISKAALRDSNVNFEQINIVKQKEHPAVKYLELWPKQSFPAAILVSPDGQSLLIPVTKPNQPFGQTLRSALDDIVSSPKREEILQHIIEAYGEILLIEGTDADENRIARKAAAGAIERIGMQLKMLPESVAQPPVLVVIEPESFSRERILLWSLGLNADKASKPLAAVLYGRMRWIGPLMKGEEISKANLTGILSVVGADCECGLDTSWTQGTMMPARWDEEIQARVAKALEFDPEHPLVKMEVSGILKQEFSYPGAPFGYRELVVELEPRPGVVGQAPSAQGENIITSKPDTAKQRPEPSLLAKGSSFFRKAIVTSIGLCVLVAIFGVAILLRARKKMLS